MFLLFQRLQAVVAKSSLSTSNFSLIFHTILMNSRCGFVMLGSLILVSPQTAIATSHPQRTCPNDSTPVICNYFLHPESKAEYAGLPHEVFNLLGQFTFHTNLQITVILELSELPPCSALKLPSFRSFRATLYALFIVNLPF